MSFTLCAFFIINGSKSRIKTNTGNGGKPKSSAQVRRTAFRHFAMSTVKFPGLFNRRINTCKGSQFFRGIKTVNVSNFRKKGSGKSRTNANNGSKLVVEGREFFFNKLVEFFELFFQKSNLLNKLPNCKRRRINKKKRPKSIFCKRL